MINTIDDEVVVSMQLKKNYLETLDRATFVQVEI